jgi:hypothetical protein
MIAAIRVIIGGKESDKFLITFVCSVLFASPEPKKLKVTTKTPPGHREEVPGPSEQS